MSKQYTFKTTRHTEWMENILDSIPFNDRSMMIREFLSLGMKAKGMKTEPVSQMSFIPLTNDQSITEESQTKVTQKTEDTSMQEFVIEEIEEDVDLEELDRRLNLMGGN